jgi:hypothetical protein
MDLKESMPSREIGEIAAAVLTDYTVHTKKKGKFI